ncbi:hypothetical protein JHK85_012566 [Glycine max]|nr:hypothetical protein JHK85_012566 [Glycine max]
MEERAPSTAEEFERVAEEKAKEARKGVASQSLGKDLKSSVIFISKSSMSLVIYTFKRLQCLHLHFKDFNVFNHLRFQKTRMSSFTFQRLQCLQSFTLSKDYNVFIYISKTSMSSVIYTYEDFNLTHSHTPKRLVHTNLVRMQPHWLIPRTQQCVHLASDESAEATREKLRNKAKKKRTQDHIPLSTFDRSKASLFGYNGSDIADHLDSIQDSEDEGFIFRLEEHPTHDIV